MAVDVDQLVETTMIWIRNIDVDLHTASCKRHFIYFLNQPDIKQICIAPIRRLMVLCPLLEI